MDRLFRTRPHNRGTVTLAVIVAITLTLTAIIITVQGITLLTIRVARTNVEDKISFYSAEALLYDTIARINRSYVPGTGYTWPDSADYQDSPNILDDISYALSITKQNNNILLDVTATTPYSSRRLVGHLQEPTDNAADTDVVLIIDRSGSMQVEGSKTCGEWGESSCDNLPGGENEIIPQPMYSAITAAGYFLELVRSEPELTNKMHVGVVKFNHTASSVQDLSIDHPNTQSKLYNLSPEGGTNIQRGLQLSYNKITSDPLARENVKKVIILLTDGLPNHFFRDDGENQFCGNESNLKNTPYYHESNDPVSATPCTIAAQEKANQIKEEGVEIYVIGLGLTEAHDYLIDANIDFAQTLLPTLASSLSHTYIIPERDQWSPEVNLLSVYKQIFNSIRSTPYLKIEELPAE